MSTKLLDSFGAVYRLLKQPRAARRVLVGLLVIHTLLLGYSAYVHSPTLNEPAHLVAGLSHWKFGRFELYRVNPPLVRMMAALPVMAVGYNEDWSAFYEGPGARPEMVMGQHFVAANGERSFFLFMIARWACIPFSWLGMIVCFLWARDMYGRPAGVMAATIWCFEPNILAHASLITPDAGATALGIAACYTFWCWLKQPTWMQAALTGVILGLAELAKTTMILFYPLWPLMWIIYRWPDRGSMLVGEWLREAGMLALRMAIGLYVLNLGYGFEGSFTKLKDFTFVSEMFVGQASRVEGPGSDNRQSASSTTAAAKNPKSQGNSFADTWLGILPVPFPNNYLLGIDIQQKDFERYGLPSYLRGVWQDHGWWFYYLYACAIKVPLGLWVLGFIALFLSFWERLGEGAFNPTPGTQLPASSFQQPTTYARDLFILLFPPIVIFTIVSSKSGFSEHMRYVLPTFPYFFIATSRVARLIAVPSPAGTCRKEGALSSSPFGRGRGARVSLLLFSKCEIPFRGCLTTTASNSYKELPHSNLASPPSSRRLRMDLLSTTVVSLFASWLIASSLWLFPHSLSYFNESIGGPHNGPKHLLGSNFDWGQDLLYLRDFLKDKESQFSVFLAYYGCFSPSDVGFSNTLPLALAYAPEGKSPNSDFGGESTNSFRLNRGVYAISVNLLYGVPWVGRDGAAIPAVVNDELIRHFREHCPVDFEGSTIWVFVIR